MVKVKPRKMLENTHSSNNPEVVEPQSGVDSAPEKRTIKYSPMTMLHDRMFMAKFFMKDSSPTL